MADPNKIEFEASLKDEGVASGAKKLEGRFKAVGKAGKESAVTITGRFRQILGVVGNIRRAISSFAFASLFVDSVTNLISKFNDARRGISETSKAVRELYKELENQAAEKSVAKIADAFKAVGKEIEDVDRKRSRQKALFDEKMSARREAEDAQMEADEADELAAVDANGPQAEISRASIRAKYELLRKKTAANRREEDLINRRENLNQSAAGKESAATSIENTLENDRDAISRIRLKAKTLDALSFERNEKDGVWYNRRKRTEEGDEVRKNQRLESLRLFDQVKKMEAELAEKQRQIDSLRKDAENDRAMSDALAPSLQATSLRREAADSSDRMRQGEIAQSRREELEKAQELASAKVSRNSLLQYEYGIKEQIKSQQSRIDDAGRSVWEAENAYTLSTKGGSAADQKAAYQSVIEAKESANEVARSANATIEALTRQLKAVSETLRQAEDVIKSSEKRRRFDVSEAFTS